MADSTAVREERPADAIREESRAPETPPPEQLAKKADSEGYNVGMAREGLGQREDGRLDAAPGRAALRQESGKAPASPAPEHRAKAKMADAGTAAGEGRPMPAAPAPRADGRFRGDRAIHGR